MKDMNLYKPGTAKYYKDTIDNIDMIIVGYDGYDPKKAESIRKLLEAIHEVSGKALKHEKMYFGEDKNEKK